VLAMTRVLQPRTRLAVRGLVAHARRTIERGRAAKRGRRMERLTADGIALTRSPAGVRSWFSRKMLWANWNRAPNAGSPHSTDKNQCR
jgi:hypothetical protein